MSLTERQCPACNSLEYEPHTTYRVGSGEQRTIYHCQCGNYFSETKNTPLEGLKTPLSRISTVLEAINDGMGLNAACRTFQVGKNSIKRWLKRLGIQYPLLGDGVGNHFWPVMYRLIDIIVIALQLTIMSWLYVTMLWKGKKV